MNNTGVIPTTTYAIQPNLFNYMRGTLSVGGYNSSDIVDGTLKWIPSPLWHPNSDSWVTWIQDVGINGNQMLSNMDKAMFVTGFDYIGLDGGT
jgi:hypothetical protein